MDKLQETTKSNEIPAGLFAGKYFNTATKRGLSLIRALSLAERRRNNMDMCIKTNPVNPGF